MAITNLIVDAGRELDLIELHIGDGRLLANPIQNINGIRGTLNTIRATLQNILAERNQYQNLLNNENRLVQDLRNEIRDTRNQCLRSEQLLEESRDQIQRITQMHTNALNDEREARKQNWQLAQNRQAELDNTQRERDEYRRNAHRMTVRYNTDTEHWRRRHASCIRQAQNWKVQYRNTQNQL
jgi:chromosome segregation ATPase